MKLHHSLIAVGAAALLGVAPLAQAASDFTSGGGTLTATANLNFRITVDRFLFLAVGTSTARADNATVDTVDFALAGTDNGVGGSVAASGPGVAVSVVGNVGSVSFQSAAPDLSNGTETIPSSEITATNAGGPSGIVHPAFGAAALTIGATAGVVNRSDTWTFNFANTAVRAAGTYTTTATYTATSP